jgi:hypothetical protein
MYQRGHPVPSLDNKPVLPDYLQVLLIIYRDLVFDGAIRYSDYCLWCDRNRVSGEQFGYLWEVLLVALNRVYEWKSIESSQNKSAETTKNTLVQRES